MSGKSKLIVDQALKLISGAGPETANKIRAYHGTSGSRIRQISENDTLRELKNFGPDTFLTENLEDARGYSGRGEDPHVYETELRISNPFVTDDYDYYAGAFQYSPELKSKGYDAVQYKPKDGQSQYMVFDPENIKIIKIIRPENRQKGEMFLGGRTGYASKGRVIGDVVDQALKLIMGVGETSVPKIKAYHVSPYDFETFKPSEFRGSTFFASTPERAKRGANAARNEMVMDTSTDLPPANYKTYEVEIDPTKIKGLHLSPSEIEWFSGLPNKIVGDEALDAATRAGMPHGLTWDDFYDYHPISEGVFEYTKKATPPSISYEDAYKTGRNVYRRQHSHYAPEADEKFAAEKTRNSGMGGYLVEDEAGTSLAVSDPDIVKILKKYSAGGRTGYASKGRVGVVGNIVDKALDLVMGEGDEAAQAGIRAYHSSPHDFDKFDLSKIGTGEGAQAYGHGLYFAESPEVSGRGGQYWNKFNSDRYRKLGPYDTHAAEMLKAQNWDREKTSEKLRELSQKYMDEAKSAANEDSKRRALYSAEGNRLSADLLDAGYHVGPHTYEVNIAADPNQLLDWDKPLSEQPEQVAKVFKRLGENDASKYGEGGGLSYYMGDPESYSGENIYRYLASQFGGPKVSEILKAEGIPGIKFLDAGSRGAATTTQSHIDYLKNQLAINEQSTLKAQSNRYTPKDYIKQLEAERNDLTAQIDKLSKETSPTHNYVIFDDKLISIIRKYGIAGASAMVGYDLLDNLDPVQAKAAAIADREYQETAQREEKAGGGKAVKEALRIAQEGIEALSRGEGKSPKELLGGFANQKPRVPFEEWRYEFEPTADLLASKEFNPESLKPGDVIIPLVGDRTSTGRKITSIAGQPLEVPAITEGGPDYMRGPSQQSDKSVWASGKGVITGLEGRIQNALRASEAKGYKYPNVYGSYVAMGPQSGDFSTHTAEAVMGMLPGSKIKRADVKEFDAKMREKFADWPGLQSPKAADYVINANAGEHRKAFLDVMDSAYWRDKGFPEVSLARYATTTPELVASPTEAAGYNIARITPSEKPEVITKVHRSYPSTMHGEYVGGLPSGLTRDELFTQFSRGFDADPPERNYVMAKRRSFGMDPNAFQVMEGQDIEDLIRKVTALKDEYADGGEVYDDDDINDALRIAKDNGGATGGVFMEDATGNKYDAQGNVIPPEVPGPNPQRSNGDMSATYRALESAKPVVKEKSDHEVWQSFTPEVRAKFSQEYPSYAAEMRKQDVAASKKQVQAMPENLRSMTHPLSPIQTSIGVGRVEMPLLGINYEFPTIEKSDYITGETYRPAESTLQSLYDFKTVPFYYTPFTAGPAAAIDVAEGMASGDPTTASLAVLFGPGGKYSKAAGIAGINYFMDPANAQAGPSKLIANAIDVAKAGIRAFHGSPHDFPPVRLIEMPDGTRLYQNMLENMDTPEGAKILEEYPLGRFDMSKIGTGEGAQAYGHGLYFAENEGIARSYRDALSPKQGQHNTFDGKRLNPSYIKQLQNSQDPAVSDFFRMYSSKSNSTKDLEQFAEEAIARSIQERDMYAKRAEEFRANPPYKSTYTAEDYDRFVSNYDKDIAKLQSVRDRIKHEKAKTLGHMYEVNIAADPNTFLDWDKPLSEQSKSVQEALAAMDPDMYAPGGADYDPSELGQIVYQRLANQKRDYGIDSGRKNLTTLGGAQAGATSDLQGFGIPGIKYLDAGSRQPAQMSQQLDSLKSQLFDAELKLEDATKKGKRHTAMVLGHQVDKLKKQIFIAQQPQSHNYVVFDDNLISIIRKYGIAGASAMVGYNLLERMDPKQALAATLADEEYQANKKNRDRGGSVTGGKSYDNDASVAHALALTREY
jgi:hypothetical protein